MHGSRLLGLGTVVLIAAGLAVAAGPAASADPGAPTTGLTFIDFGRDFLPTAVNNSGVVVGTSSWANGVKPQVWVGGTVRPLPLPDPPAGHVYAPVGGVLLNASGLAVTTLSRRMTDGTHPVGVPVAWQIGSDGTPSPARVLETPAGDDPADSLAAAAINSAGNVLIRRTDTGTTDTHITAPDAGAASAVPATGYPITMSATSFTADTVSGSDQRYQSIAIGDLTKRSTPPVIPTAESDKGWLVGPLLSNTQTEGLIDPAGTATTLPPGGWNMVDDNGDVAGGSEILYHGATTPTSVDSMIPATAGYPAGFTQIDGIDADGDIVGAGQPGGPLDGYLLRAPRTTTPPVVNSTADRGVTDDGKQGCDTGRTITVGGRSVPECTLRAAIETENAGTVDQKTITFSTSLTASSSAVISPATALPAVTAAGITIDFASGTTGSSTVELDHSGDAGTSIGLDVKASGVTVKGLQVHGFGTGLLLAGPGHDTVHGSVLGRGAGGDTADTMGVEITSPSDVIGGSTAAERNVIAGNTTFGVYIHGTGASGTTVSGDYIGVYADGRTEAANQVGVWIRDASGTTVGGSTATPGIGAGNLFNGGGTSDGAISVVGISTKVNGTVIVGNSFGLAADGSAFDSTCGHEISVLGSTQDTRIGGGSGSGNALDGRCQREIQVSSTQSTGTQILGNRIGTDSSGTHELTGFAVDNTAVAIGVSGATHTTIGQPGEANLVLGGFSSAIQTQTVAAAATIEYPSSTAVPGTGTTLKGASSTLISGNSLGVLADVPSTSVLGTGVIVTGSGDTISHNQIALTPAAIDIEKATGPETVSANLLGVTAGGTGALPLADGVLVSASAKTTVTGNTVHTAGPAIALLSSANSQVSSNKIDVTASGNGPLTAYTGPLPPGWAEAVAALQRVGVTVDHKSGAALVRGNVVGTVAGPGLVIDAAASLVDDNHIGVGLDGHTAIGNTGDGIDVTADNVTVGAAGTGTKLTGTGNVIADNAGAGVNIAVNHKNVAVRSNAIHDNTNGAIILSGNANAAISAPQPVAAVQDGHGHTVVFVHGLTGSTVQVYAAANCPAGDAEPGTPAQGQALLASAGIDATGSRAVAVPLQPVGTSIDATVTDPALGTSQFSGCIAVAPAAKGTVTDPNLNDGTSDTVQGSGFTPGEPVQGQLHSAPINLGTRTADAHGNATFTVTAPRTLPAGAHYVVLQGRTSGAAVAVAITVRTVASAPRALIAHAGKASVALSWAAPATNGGAAITGYRVLRSTDGRTFSRVATTIARSWTATKLTGGRRYWFEIQASNAAGTSPSSGKLAAIPYTAPSAPRSLKAKAGVRQVGLRWTAPASTHGAAVTGYVVQYAACAAGHESCAWPAKSTSVHTRTVRTRSVTLRGLAHRRYEFRVLAVNRAGRGPTSLRVVAEPRV